MYRVARPPLSKLIALLPAADPPPTFDELECNLSRACVPVTVRQNASGSHIRAVLQEPSGIRRFDVEVNATEFLPRYLELARLRGGTSTQPSPASSSSPSAASSGATFSTRCTPNSGSWLRSLRRRSRCST